MEALKKLARDRRGTSFTVAGVISLFVGILLFAYLGPVALDQIYNASVTGWGTADTTMWYLIPVLFVVVVLAKVAYGLAGKGELYGLSGTISKLRKLYKDRRGQNIGNMVVNIVIVLIVFASIMGTAILGIYTNFATNRTSWTAQATGSTVISLGQLVALFGILAVFIALAKKVGGGK